MSELENAPIAEQTPDTAQQPAPPEDKRQQPLSDAKKNALLRYMTVLFAVAFLLDRKSVV